MELKIDNLHIVKNIEDIDVKELKENDQVIVLEEHTFDDNKNEERNGFNISNMFLYENILDSIYCFNRHDIENNIYDYNKDYSFKNHKFSFNDEENEEEFSSYHTVINDMRVQKFDSSYFLNIDNELFSINDINILGQPEDLLRTNNRTFNFEQKYLTQILSYLSEYQYLNTIYSNSLFNIDNVNKKEAMFYLNVPLGKHSLLILIHNDINEEKLIRNCKFLTYLISENVDIIRLTIDIDKLMNIIKAGPYNYSIYLKEFVDIYFKTYKHDIDKYINDKSIIDIFHKAFYSYINISDFFDPIYTDDEIGFTGYIDSINNQYYHNNCNYDIDEIKMKKITGQNRVYYAKEHIEYKNAIRITNAILKYYRNDSIVNPFNGSITDENISEEYRDEGGMILKGKNGYKFAYVKIKDHYVPANSNEIKEIDDRINVLNTLLLNTNENF